MTVLQVCLNGGRTRAEHPGVPLTPAELAVAAAEVAGLGVTEVHLHPRDADGAESLHREDVLAAVAAVRAAAPGLEVGVTTRAESCSDRVSRLRLVEEWPGPQEGGPDFASVNWHEPGAADLASALAFAGIGVEVGIFRPAAATAFGAVAREGIRRVLVEVIPGEVPGDPRDPGCGIDAAREVRAALLSSRAGDVLRGIPTIVHGEEVWAWPVLAWARDAGFDVRIGLEDTLLRPGGRTAADNAELARIALGQVDRPVTGHLEVSDGTRVDHEVYGDGPWLVLLQPPGADGPDRVAAVLPDLALRHQVVVVRLPSGRPTVRLVTDAVEVLMALRVGPADVLGIGAGATVAVGLARAHPALVRRLVLLSAPSPEPVGVPTLLVLGDQEPLGEAADAVRRVSSLQLAVLPGTGTGTDGVGSRPDLLLPLLEGFLVD